MVMQNLAVIGLGYWGPNLARNISASSRTQLSGLCDRDASRLETVGSMYPHATTYADANDVFSSPDIDAVAIATPVSTHYGLARAALQSGKHVLIEKPLAATSQEALDLIELARKVNRVLMVDHVFLYSPAVRKLVEVCHSGELGDLNFIDSVRINLGLIQSDVNVLWDLAPHDLSIIDAIVGVPPVTVSAVGRSHVANGTVDVSYLHLDYREVTGAIHLNWLSPVKVRHLMVGGAKKSVLYNDLDAAEPIKIYDSGVNIADDPKSIRGLLVSYRSGDVLSPRVDSYEPLSAMITHFADCIERGADPVSGGEQGLRVVRILEAADRSLAQHGAPISVEA